MVGIIIQARMGSQRLPGKTLAAIEGYPLLYYSVKRAMMSKYADYVVVATTLSKIDDDIYKWCESNDIASFRGSEDDVLDRYYRCAKKNKMDIIVRVTADNPFIDPMIIDMLITSLICYDKDYVTIRTKTNTWPYGLDVEVFTISALKEAREKSKSQYHREHVTTYIKDNLDLFDILEIPLDKELAHVRLTVDLHEDLQRARHMLKLLLKSYGIGFSWIDACNVYEDGLL